MEALVERVVTVGDLVQGTGSIQQAATVSPLVDQCAPLFRTSPVDVTATLGGVQPLDIFLLLEKIENG